MDLIQAVILGIVQGLTEFLPISSSGHLVICQQYLGLKSAELYFDVSVHIGTLFAVFIFFRRDLQAILLSLVRGIQTTLRKESTFPELLRADLNMKMAVLIAIGSVPTIIIGLILYRWSEIIFASIVITGSMLVLTGALLFATGFLLWTTRKIEKPTKDISAFSFKAAVLIGFVQGLAIIPGISRSGSTIAVGLFMGIDREIAARYSFLLSIPAIIGAGLLTLKDIPEGSHFSLSLTLIGAVTSCGVGYISLRFLVYLVKKGNLYLFAPYCWIAGLLALYWGT